MPFLDSHSLRTAFVANLLERLVDQIVGQGEELLREAGVEFPPRAASTVLLLGEHGRMSAADIARSLALPHQLVTQRIDLLIELGIVARIDDPKDARRKVVRLTAKGRKQLQKLQSRLVLAEAAFMALFKEIGCDLSAAALKAMEALNHSSLLARTKQLKAIA